MKKAVSIFLSLIMIMSLCSVSYAKQSEPSISAEAAILIDATNGNILYEKNADKKMYPASTTKIMTALLALDKISAGELSLEQPVTYTQSAEDTMAADGSNIALKVGETMVMDDLLKGLLLASGNDAAAIIAETIGGDIQTFVGMMNQKASELGLKNTHFENPHGLHSENHYSTAEDLATIAREAMKNETFASIVECAHIRLAPTNMSEERYYINTNNLVSKMRYPYYYYDKATGIKTGSTTEAGYCLVSSAKDGNKEVIAVVLKAKDISSSHTDSKNILEYGLSGFSSIRLAKLGDVYGEVKVKQSSDGTDHILLSANENLEILFSKDGNQKEIEQVLNIPEKIYAPVKKGQVIGSVDFVYNSKVIGSVPLASTVEVKRHLLGFLMSFGEWLWSFRGVKIAVYSAITIVVLFLALLIFGFARAIKKSKRKKRRRSRYQPPRY